MTVCCYKTSRTFVDNCRHFDRIFFFHLHVRTTFCLSNMANIRHGVVCLPNHKTHIPEESNIEIQFWFMPNTLIYSTKTQIQQKKISLYWMRILFFFLDKQLRRWVNGAWHFEDGVFAESLQPGGRRRCAASKRWQLPTQWRGVVSRKNGVFQSQRRSKYKLTKTTEMLTNIWSRNTYRILHACGHVLPQGHRSRIKPYNRVLRNCDKE